MKKRVLVLSPYFPYPARDGGKVRLYNVIRHLSLTCDVFLLSYIETPGVSEFVPEMERFCRVRTVLRDESARILTDAVPRCPTFYYTPDMIRALEETLASFRPDIVHIEFLIMTQYRYHITGVPVVYTEHDMSSISFEQSFHDRDLPEQERFIAWTQLVHYQKQVTKTFDLAVVLTERDRVLLDAFAPGVRSVVVPTGVDIGHFAFTPQPVLPQRLVFVGHYRHHPNFDAVQYFVRDILPLAAAAFPAVRFEVVGSGVPPALLSLEHPNLRIIGEVVDVATQLSSGGIFVAPVRLGGGIKGKVLEAMSSGLPVVASAESAEGIGARDGVEMLIARDPHAFAQAICALLRDPGRAAALAAAARRMVEERFDWRMLVRTLDAAYDSVLAARAR